MKAAIIAGCVVLSVLSAPGAHAGAERVCPAHRLADGKWNEDEVRECMARVNRTIKPHETGHWVWKSPPPPEFDKPYEGVLVVHRTPIADIEKMCIDIYGRSAHACNFRIPGYSDGKIARPPACIILLPPDEVIDQHREDAKDIIRHETGHCNGWPPDHPNRQSRWEWVEK